MKRNEKKWVETTGRCSKGEGFDGLVTDGYDGLIDKDSICEKDTI